MLWIRGLYDALYPIKAAAAKAWPDGMKLTTVYQRKMPKTLAELAPYGTLILPNVPLDAAGVVFRKALADWTRAGGHLVVLGGSLSLGQGAMAGTFVADVLPCELQMGPDVVKLPDNSVIQPGGARLYYAHTVKAKPGARVLATCGGRPIWLTHAAGKGRSSVFAGTVLGAPGNQSEAFWNDKAWVKALAGCLAGK